MFNITRKKGIYIKITGTEALLYSSMFLPYTTFTRDLTEFPAAPNLQYSNINFPDRMLCCDKKELIVSSLFTFVCHIILDNGCTSFLQPCGYDLSLAISHILIHFTAEGPVLSDSYVHIKFLRLRSYMLLQVRTTRYMRSRCF